MVLGRDPETVDEGEKGGGLGEGAKKTKRHRLNLCYFLGTCTEIPIL